MILTKAPWIFDPNGDRDRQDITLLYKPKEGKRYERTVLCLKYYRIVPKRTRVLEISSPDEAEVTCSLLEFSWQIKSSSPKEFVQPN